MKQEATLSYSIAYVIAFIMIIFVFVAGIPFMLTVNTEFHTAGRNILDMGLRDAAKITNVTVKNAMTTILTDNKAALTSTEPFLAKFAQYGWIFVVIVVALVVVILARRAEMEDQARGFV